MFQVVEKLKEEKEKLIGEFEESRIEYKAEVKRINKAIRKFSQGYEALGASLPENSQKRSAITEIERILKSGAKPIKEIVGELRKSGFNSHYQSVSGMLQTYAKTNNKFKKVAPGTFALISEEKHRI